jgi:transcriptional antiterminator NusG
MQEICSEAGWHAAFVVTGEEENVKERLLYRYKDFIKVVVPKRKLRERKNGVWTTITKVLFPGYVLLNGSSCELSRCDFRTVPKIIRPLRSGYDLVSIDENEIKVLSKLIRDDEVIDFSSVFIKDGKVRVTDGPLLSMEGLIISVDHRKGRAKVSLDFLGDSRVVDLGINMLVPAGVQQ